MLAAKTTNDLSEHGVAIGWAGWTVIDGLVVRDLKRHKLPDWGRR